jgi:hypothetical protein
MVNGASQYSLWHGVEKRSADVRVGGPFVGLPRGQQRPAEAFFTRFCGPRAQGTRDDS